MAFTYIQPTFIRRSEKGKMNPANAAFQIVMGLLSSNKKQEYQRYAQEQKMYQSLSEINPYEIEDTEYKRDIENQIKTIENNIVSLSASKKGMFKGVYTTEEQMAIYRNIVKLQQKIDKHQKDAAAMFKVQTDYTTNPELYEAEDWSLQQQYFYTEHVAPKGGFKLKPARIDSDLYYSNYQDKLGRVERQEAEGNNIVTVASYPNATSDTRRKKIEDDYISNLGLQKDMREKFNNSDAVKVFQDERFQIQKEQFDKIWDVAQQSAGQGSPFYNAMLNEDTKNQAFVKYLEKRHPDIYNTEAIRWNQNKFESKIMPKEQKTYVFNPSLYSSNQTYKRMMAKEGMDLAEARAEETAKEQEELQGKYRFTKRGNQDVMAFIDPKTTELDEETLKEFFPDVEITPLHSYSFRPSNLYKSGNLGVLFNDESGSTAVSTVSVKNRTISFSS